MKRAAIYARVSTAGQARDGTSLDTQLEACRARAEELGYIVVKEIQEDFTGSRLDRPGLDAVRDLVERGEVEAVICFDPDRLSRKVAHFALLQEDFERRRVRLEIVNAPAEDTPEGQLMLMIRSSFAEYERSKIMERTRRGKERRVREGKIFKNTFVPYGYTYNAETSAYEIYEPEATWVRKLFSWLVDERMSLRSITQQLTQVGAPTKQGASKWAAATVLGILRNQMYAGTWYYNKRRAVEPSKRRHPVGKRQKTSHVDRPPEEWIAVEVPAIVDVETHQAVQRQLDLNKALQSRKGRRPYLLSGMLFCKQCNYRLQGHTTARKRRRTLESCYQCSAHRSGRGSPDCPRSWLHADKLEARIWDEVVAQMSDEKLITEQLRGRETNVLESRRKADEELTALYSSQAGLKREMDKVLELYRRDSIDATTVEEQLSGIKKRQDGITAAIEDILAKVDAAQAAYASYETLERLVALAQRGLPHLDWEQRRAFLEGIEFKGVVDGKKIAISGLITDRVLDLDQNLEDDASLCKADRQTVNRKMHTSSIRLPISGTVDLNEPAA